MNKILRNFPLEQEISLLVKIYFNPPEMYIIEDLGIFKYKNQLYTFSKYKGIEIEEPVYDYDTEYVISIIEDIKNYFDKSDNIKDYSYEEIKENTKFIYQHVIERIEEYEYI